jgi:hypothetical protein
MPVRTVTRRWSDIGAFLSEYPSTLKVGALVLPSDALGGDEPAPEVKVDLHLPLVGRVGPLECQVLGPVPGGWATRVASIPPRAEQAIAEVFGAVQAVRAHLLATGDVVPRVAAPAAPLAPMVAFDKEVEALRARVAELEHALAARATVAAPGVEAASARTGGRGYPVPPLQNIPPTLAGDLGDRSLRDAFMALAIERMTGILTIHTAGRTRWGFWSKGGPVGWRTELVVEEEVLGVLLYRAGSVTKEQLAQSLEVMEARGIRQGDALIEMGVLTFAQLVVLLQKQAEFVFQRILLDRDGEWSFHALDDLTERFIAPPVRVASLMYKALLQHAKDMPAEELAGALQASLDRYLYIAPGVEQTFDDMKLNTDEQALTKIISSKPWRLREIFSVSSLSRMQTASVLWVLAELNLVDFREEGGQARASEDLRRDMEARYKQVTSGTMFDRLGLHWICTAAEVEAAWKRLDSEFRPEVAQKRWGQENAAYAQEVYAAARAAYDALRNDAARRDYRVKLFDRTRLGQTADMLGKKGEMALMKGSQREALECFSKALELSPTDADLRTGYERARAIRG